MNLYSRILEAIFARHHHEGDSQFEFDRAEIIEAAQDLGIRIPKNVGDLVYSFRYRATLPPIVTAAAPEGYGWLIRPAGSGRYKMVLARSLDLTPSQVLVETKIPDATPGIIARYALGDEQALLARLRYNRLIDVFTGLTCYSLQNHLRTSVRGLGQVETDEIYVGLDRKGAQYVIPVQAKGARDRIGIVQLEQDTALCEAKFPDLICRPVAAQSTADGLIALFEMQLDGDAMRVAEERHYRLVPPDQLSAEDSGRVPQARILTLGADRSSRRRASTAGAPRCLQRGTSNLKLQLPRLPASVES